MILEKNDGNACCTSNTMPIGQCCKVESVISVDDRGQMVLPKEIRDKAKIHAGDKLAVVSWEKDGEVCCISLIKVSDLAEMVKDMLGPVMSDIFQK
jgi:antitoxin PrlF